MSVRHRCYPTKSPFSNIYTNMTLYHLKPSSSNLYWPSTSQYRHILIQYHQVPLLIHHLDRHSSANWIISLFMTHLMSHAQYTWSSLLQHLQKIVTHMMYTVNRCAPSACPAIQTATMQIQKRSSLAGARQATVMGFLLTFRWPLEQGRLKE